VTDRSAAAVRVAVPFEKRHNHQRVEQHSGGYLLILQCRRAPRKPYIVDLEGALLGSGRRPRLEPRWHQRCHRSRTANQLPRKRCLVRRSLDDPSTTIRGHSSPSHMWPYYGGPFRTPLSYAASSRRCRGRRTFSAVVTRESLLYARAFPATVDSRAKPGCEPRSFADQSILIEVMNTIMGP
jgi:hypothetical protein